MRVPIARFRPSVVSLLSEYLTPVGKSIEGWKREKEATGVDNKTWASTHKTKWVLRHASDKPGKWKKGDIYRGPGTYEKMLSILRAEKAGGW